MTDKTAATSQAAWPLLSEGLSAARLDAHRLRHLIHRALKLVETAEERDQIYRLAGDIIQAVPGVLESMEAHLDRTTYALVVLGEEHLRDRLSYNDRNLVDDATHRAKPFGGNQPKQAPSAAQRVARRYLARELDPQLGWPGGACHLIHRVQEEAPPRAVEPLTDHVETFGELPKRTERGIYTHNKFPLSGLRFLKGMVLTPHAQHRMDQRNVTVADLKVLFKHWDAAFVRGRELAGGTPRKPALRLLAQQAREWEAAISYKERIDWVDPAIRLRVVFEVNAGMAEVVTVMWPGMPDPRPPGEGACKI